MRAHAMSLNRCAQRPRRHGLPKPEPVTTTAAVSDGSHGLEHLNAADQRVFWLEHTGERAELSEPGIGLMVAVRSM
jgi:hypothetical protein